jgi:hypothetical protein
MTLSLACTFDARDPFDPDWRHAHRHYDGMHFRPVTDKAVADDHFRSTTIHKLLIPWAQTNPHTRITVENPKYSVFLHMQDVIDLCNTRLLLCTLRGMSTTSTTASCTTQGWTHQPPKSRRLSSLTGTSPSKSCVPRQVDVTSCFRTASIINTAFAGTKTCLPNRNE